jgi:acetolactate synthase-1/2/3 large subunit
MADHDDPSIEDEALAPADDTTAAADDDHATPNDEPAADAVTAAEAMLRSLKRHGVDYFFSNLGSDHPPILEALARAREAGTREQLPELIVCPHEFPAVSAAHGYAVATGQPQGVLVHVDVGTLNAGGAMHNAHRANVPVFVLAGLAPVTETGYLGSRDSSVHYIQDVPDQLELVEQYCRWTTEYRLPADPDAVVRRGLERASAPPAGPVYVAATREAMEGTDFATSDPERTVREVEPPGADDRTLERLAGVIDRADRPVVVTSALGRDPANVERLVTFAERAGVGVVEHRPTALSFPRDHELHLGYSPAAVFEDADLLVLADVDVPWIPSKAAPSEDCTILQIDADPTKADYPQWDFEVDTTVTADPGRVLAALTDRVDSDAAGERRDAWAAAVADRRQAVERELDVDGERLTPAILSDALNAVVDEDTVVVDDSVTSKRSVLDHLELTEPGSYHMKGGSALGWAPGAAVGVKLARPEKRVVALTGDGAYVFANPTASTWMAVRHDAPVLTVVYNNSGWNAVKRATTSQHPEGEAADDTVPESRFEPTIDLSAPAESVDAFTRQVRTREELSAALEDALAALDDGRPATIDVVLEPM